MAVLSVSISNNTYFLWPQNIYWILPPSSKFILLSKLWALWNHGISSTGSEFIVFFYGCIKYKCFADYSKNGKSSLLARGIFRSCTKGTEITSVLYWLILTFMTGLYCAAVGPWLIRETAGGSRKKPKRFEPHHVVHSPLIACLALKIKTLQHYETSLSIY
jgi:hypothetical protein